MKSSRLLYICLLASSKWIWPFCINVFVPELSNLPRNAPSALHRVTFIHHLTQMTGINRHIHTKRTHSHHWPGAMLLRWHQCTIRLSLYISARPRIASWLTFSENNGRTGRPHYTRGAGACATDVSTLPRGVVASADASCGSNSNNRALSPRPTGW